jgi:hypothetical protein
MCFNNALSPRFQKRVFKTALLKTISQKRAFRNAFVMFFEIVTTSAFLKRVSMNALSNVFPKRVPKNVFLKITFHQRVFTASAKTCFLETRFKRVLKAYFKRVL